MTTTLEDLIARAGVEAAKTVSSLAQASADLNEMAADNAALLAKIIDHEKTIQALREEVAVLADANSALVDKVEELTAQQPTPEPEPAPEPEPTPEPEPAPEPPEAPVVFVPPDHAGDLHYEAWPVEAPPVPPDRQWFRDPVFGSNIIRLPDGMRHVYSQLQPFSQQSSHMIVFGSVQGEYGIFNLDKWSYSSLAGYSSPRWSAHGVFSASRDKIRIGNMVKDWQGGSIAVPNSFESPDNNGQTVALLDQAGIVYVVEIYSLNVLYQFQVEGSVNWVRVAPTGPNDGVIIQYDAAKTEWRSPDGKLISQIVNNHRHSDLASYGDGFYYAYNRWVGEGGQQSEQAIVLWDSVTKKTKPLVPYSAWGRANHISCTGPDVVVSAGTKYSNTEFQGEVWMAPVDGSIRRVCHHHSDYRSSNRYWEQVHAAQSADGRYVAFASNWKTSGFYGFVVDLES